MTATSTVVPNGYKQTAVGVIPEDWDVSCLRSLCTDISDGTHFTPRYISQGVPFYSVENVTANDFANIKFISEAEHKALIKRCKPERGDILMTRIGSLGDTKLIDWDVNASIYVSLALLKPDDRINSAYLYCYSKSTRFVADVEDRSLLNATPKKINMVDIGAVPIPVPQLLAEQETIAEALGDADALIESLEQLVAKKRQLKQATMQQLLTGKARHPGFEVKPGYKQSDVGVIPKDWDPRTVGEITTKVGSGITPLGGNSNYRDFGRPFVRSQNVGWGILQLDDLVFIDDATHATFSATELIANDVLLNITGASIGRCSVADARVAAGNVNQHVCIIRVHGSAAEPRFLQHVLLSRIGQRQIESFQAGGNREGLNFGQIRSMQIPLPPTVTEQEAIAEIVCDMDAEITAIEAKLAKARQIKQGMMQELLTGRTRLI